MTVLCVTNMHSWSQIKYSVRKYIILSSLTYSLWTPALWWKTLDYFLWCNIFEFHNCHYAYIIFYYSVEVVGSVDRQQKRFFLSYQMHLPFQMANHLPFANGKNFCHLQRYKILNTYLGYKNQKRSLFDDLWTWKL